MSRLVPTCQPLFLPVTPAVPARDSATETEALDLKLATAMPPATR